MISSDFHIHTCYCDGKDSPENIILQAISLGMKKLGFSGHAHTPFDEDACMSLENTEKYKREISRLKREYQSKIKIFCGVEQDYFSDTDASSYDFIIGSVHYVECGGEFLSVDDTPEILSRLIHKCNDDPYEVAAKYFALVSDVVNKTGANIIGHFDLLTKFNAGNKFFDEHNQRYKNAARSALDALLKTGRPFEINTGAIAKGYKNFPYPSREILEYISAHNGRVILSSDAHKKENLMYEFPKYEALAKSLGLKVIEL